MHTVRDVYNQYQTVYREMGPSFTPEHRVFKRGAVRMALGGPGRNYHLPHSGCLFEPPREKVVDVSGDDVRWEMVCGVCARVSSVPPLWSVTELRYAAQRVLTAVAGGGGKVADTSGIFPTELIELLTSDQFPLPVADHPRDWYDFWIAFNSFLVALQTADLSREFEFFSGLDSWTAALETSALAAFKRWLRDVDVFASLMYARARFAMLERDANRRQGEIPLYFKRTPPPASWPYTGTSLLYARLADRDAIASHHLAVLSPGDVETVGEYLEDLDYLLRRLALEQAADVVDVELNAQWDGPNTLLAWNAQLPTDPAAQLPLGGWFFPAFVNQTSGDQVLLGTVAQAHANGGLDAFSLIWETANALDETSGWDDRLRAAHAALQTPVPASI